MGVQRLAEERVRILQWGAMRPVTFPRAGAVFSRDAGAGPGRLCRAGVENE
jgi:hypothetical protein